MSLKDWSLDQWQRRWDESLRGRWTHRLIPRVREWIGSKHGEVGFYLTQLLTGHGCTRAYLHRFHLDTSDECPTCEGVMEDVEHVFFRCPRFAEQRREVEHATGGKVTPELLAP